MAYLASKPRYEILDGLRGVAAIIVVAFHLFETYAGRLGMQILDHGYLAVDFFFVLSGYVIGYAYDDRWGKMTVGDFFKRRLVRLHPMLILGTVIGGLLFYFGAGYDYDGNPATDAILSTPWWQVVLLTLLGCTMLPALKSWDIRGWGEMNALNGATWSLFWEYIGNILYALFIRHLSKTLLTVFVLLSAILTIDMSLNLDIFGLLAGRAYAANTVIGGWSLDAEQCYIGISRLLYPFFCGLLLSRIGTKIKVKGGFWWCALLIVILLCMPYVEGGERGSWTCLNGFYNAFCILIMFPLIVIMGAGSNVSGKRSTAVCNFLGELSYPLYVTHYPLIYLQMGWAARNPEAPLGTHIAVAVSLFIIAIAIAYASLRLYDTPVREWLKNRFLIKKKS